jgi:hypothetical protein
MGKHMISFLIISSFSLISWSQIAKNETEIMDFLNKKEGWEKSEIVQLNVKLNKKKEVLLFKSNLECGSGTCDQYLFIKNEKGTFQGIGVINGHFKIRNETSNGFFNLESISSVGASETEKTTTLWKFNGSQYVAQ